MGWWSKFFGGVAIGLLHVFFRRKKAWKWKQSMWKLKLQYDRSAVFENSGDPIVGRKSNGESTWIGACQAMSRWCDPKCKTVGHTFHTAELHRILCLFVYETTVDHCALQWWKLTPFQVLQAVLFTSFASSYSILHESQKVLWETCWETCWKLDLREMIHDDPYDWLLTLWFLDL